jgi:aminoglycoside/choline kinase family phosphotransferase
MTHEIQDNSRATLRLDWARHALNDASAQLTRASVDAGFRSYWRSTGNGPSRIVMDSPPGLEDVRPWLHVRELLAAGGVCVPAVLASDVEAGFLLLEDLGVPTLAQAINAENADAYFDAAINQLLTLQRITPPDGVGEFGTVLLQRDAGLFEEWFLRKHLGLELDCGDIERLDLTQRQLMDNALSQARVLTHRDFMPRNLMPFCNGLAVIDFQDCVCGPIAYDAMSLFKDAFLSWPLAHVDGWLAQYHQRALEAGLPVPSLPIFQRDADWMGVQRHLKILGIFCRLHYRDGKSRYIADLPRFIVYLDEILPRYRELQPLAELMEEKIKPALKERA